MPNYPRNKRICHSVCPLQGASYGCDSMAECPSELEEIKRTFPLRRCCDGESFWVPHSGFGLARRTSDTAVLDAKPA